MTDYFTIVATEEEVVEVMENDESWADFEHWHLDWVTESSLTDLLNILRGNEPFAEDDHNNPAERERYNKVYSEFEYFNYDGPSPYWIATPPELTMSIAALSGDDYRRVMREWGNTSQLRFDGKSWNEEVYWSEVEEIFTAFYKMCQMAREQEKDIFLMILV